MDKRDPNIYEFADFRLIPAEGLLLRNGQQISLPPKAFSTLALLVRRHGHLVEKTELIESVWENAFVEEAAVSRCVWDIRNALGDDRKKKTLIQTVPKRGYRFMADVKTTAGEPARSPFVSDLEPMRSGQAVGHRTISRSQLALADNPARETVIRFPEANISGTKIEDKDHTAEPGGTPNLFKRLIIPVAIVLLAVGTFAAYRYLLPGTASITNSSPRLAVLPLKPVNEEDRDRSLEFAIADSLILKISASKEFNVRQLSAVRKFVDIHQDPVQAGRELESDYVLASNYQVANGRVRVTSHLLNVHNGETEHTFVSETDAGNIFSVRDGISNEIGNALFARFGAPATEYTARRGTQSEEAANLYYEALYLIDKNNKDDSARAAELLGESLAIDPNYAQAWALRAQAYCFFSHQGGGEPDQLFTIAEPMLEKALMIDENNSVAYTVKGTINRDYHWNFAEAYRDLRRAIKADPNYNVPHRILAGLYYRDGRFAEAVEEQKRAIEISPTSVFDKSFLGNYLVAAGHKQEGITQLDRVAEMNPNFTGVYYSLWNIYHRQGDHEKAYANFIKLKEVSRQYPEWIPKYKAAYAKGGWPAVLRTELDLVLSKEPKGKYCDGKYYIAVIASILGEKDLAFEYLNLALRYRLLGISFLKVDPHLDGLRNDPRFDDLLVRAGLAQSS